MNSPYLPLLVVLLLCAFFVLVWKYIRTKTELERLKANKTFLERELEQTKYRQENIKTEVEQFFTVSSEAVLAKRMQALDKENEEFVRNIVNPLKEKISEFQNLVNITYSSDTKDRTELKSLIRQLSMQNQDLGDEAKNLTKALRGDNKVQGDWGEMQLENLLSNSGLVKGREYETQYQLQGDNNRGVLHEETGKRLRPDLVVHFPYQRDVIIDAKVSLSAYYDYVAADNTNDEQEAKNRHIVSIKRHIQELSQKDYSHYSKNSLEFVILFVPTEAALSLVLREEPDLWNNAYRKKVVLMGPFNLVAMLRSLYDMWQKEYQMENVENIVSEAEKLLDKFYLFTNSFSAINKQIDQLKETYEKAERQLCEGKGNVISKIEKLQNLGLNPTKKIDPSLHKKSQLYDWKHARSNDMIS